MSVLYDIEDFLGMVFLFAALLVFFFAIKKISEKALEIDEAVMEKKRHSFFETSKIVLIGVIVGLLYYLTPILQETVKIVLSLIITLGAFIATFIVKEKNGYNFGARIAVFVGELFFGVTMFLLMVNTNLGYSPLFILFIWSIFNFYIYKQFGNAENKALFVITTILATVIAFKEYVIDFEPDVLLIGTAVILLVCQFFNVRKGLFGKLVHNILVTLIVIFALGCSVNDKVLLSFIVTLILLIGTILLILFASKSEKLNPRSFLVYIPFVAVLLINGWYEELGVMIALFNALAVVWLLSEKSFYKKLLAGIGVIEGSLILMESMQSDALYQVIVIASVVLTLILLLEPKKKVVIEEGDVENEE